ncbi:STAS domain-containing protein [Streptomyces triticiradicis]|uniref:STAS domain-containing protein n=1 Tax=Streptomyces triticiradicis TaxID=2651189 RepID=UPI00385096BB
MTLKVTHVTDVTGDGSGAGGTGRGSADGPGAPRRREDEWAVLRVSGELDLVTSPALRQSVHDVVATGRHSIVLDLSGVVFCDSSGVGVLIAARRLVRSCRGRLRLILPAGGAADGSHVNRVLGALGVRRLFDVYPDVDAAVDEESRPLSA